jgi:Uncharacterized conserved protein (COG2071)
MLSLLKNHPFAVEAFFESSLVFTFAAPKEEVQRLLPECLQLDTFKDKWAFIAVAMVQTKNLRPKGFPQLLGNDFFLIGYRVFVRFTNKTGKTLRGLYILKSETDTSNMEFWGNIFTHYHYTTTDITQTEADGIIEIVSSKSGFNISADTTRNENVSLPCGSPFTSWKEARRFAGPLPFTFTYNSATRKMLVIEGVRENWRPLPVVVVDYHFSWINNLKLDDMVLANAFIIRGIPYYWKKGKIEQWNTEEKNFKAY